MFRHNLLVIYRNFKRFKSTFFINLTGLSAGLACSLLIYLWVNDELSIDKFHEKDARLYQVMENRIQAQGIQTAQSTSAPLAETLKN
jgi:putative ABC transport system permease protein